MYSALVVEGQGLSQSGVLSFGIPFGSGIHLFPPDLPFATVSRYWDKTKKLGLSWLSYDNSLGSNGLASAINGTPPSAGVYPLNLAVLWSAVDTFGLPNPYSLSLTLVVTTADVSPSPVTSPATPTTVIPANQANLTFFQARAEAIAGARIARGIWADRWVEFDGFLWWIQFFDPTSKATGERHVVQAVDWNSDAFRKSDWTTFGLPGQIASAGTNHAAIPSTLSFP